MKSMPASSAMRAILRQSGQLASQRSGTSVGVRADEQFAPNKPTFSPLALCISTRWRSDPFGAGNVVFCMSQDPKFCHAVLPIKRRHERTFKQRARSYHRDDAFWSQTDFMLIRE